MTMNRENRLLVADEPIEFDILLVEVKASERLAISLEEFIEYTSNQ